jgi:putative transposase
MRRCSRVLGQRRGSIYHKPKRKNADEQIGQMLKSKAGENPTWGFRMLFHWMRNQGKPWNKKRVYRVYKAENLHIRKAKSRPKVKRVALNLLAAKKLNEGWSMDFLSDVLLSEDKKVRVLNVLDECSRKALLCFAAKSISGRKLVGLLEELVLAHGKPAYFRCDNGPEFISNQLKKFAANKGIDIRYSQPGKPTQNGLVERLNGTQRTECLNLKYFKTVKDVQQDLDKWWTSYNFDRPHSALGYLTPQQFIDKNQKLYFKLGTA